MKQIILLLGLMTIGFSALGQSDTIPANPSDSSSISEAPDFYYYIIGNWRNGPEVLIGPPMAGSEQKTMDQMKDEAIAQLPEFKGVMDIDVVVEPSVDSAEHSRRLLGAKYQSRKLEVKLLTLQK